MLLHSLVQPLLLHGRGLLHGGRRVHFHLQLLLLGNHIIWDECNLGDVNVETDTGKGDTQQG